MALQFPSSPTNGQIYYDPTSGNRYIYDSATTSWKYAANNDPVTTSSNTQVIYNNNGGVIGSSGLTFSSNTLYTNTINVSQNVNAQYYFGNGASLTGIVNDFSPAFNQANAAFDKANNALANTSNVVFAGDLRVTGNVFVGTSTVTITNNSITATSITVTDLFVNGSAVPSGAVSNLAFDTANAAFSQSNTLATSANAYADVVGTSSNNYLGSLVNSASAIAVGAFGVANNAYTATNGAASFALTNTTYAAVNSAFDVVNAAFGQANTLKTSANAYADLVGTSANNYAGYMANSANSYAASLTPDLSPAFNKANSAYTNSNGAFDKANSVATGANAYADLVGTAGNTYAAAVGVAANTYADATFLKLTAASQTITGNVSITGNLTLLGGSTIISSNNLSVGDSLIYLAANNYSGTDLLDIGFIANYGNTTGANVHTGLVRDATDKQYYLFSGYDAEPANNHFAPGSNNMVNAVLVADLNTSNLTLGGANAITWITSGFGVANAAYGQANTLATSANAYAAAVGVSSNAYADVVGTSGNAFATAVGTAGNAYAVTVGTSGNNYAATVGTSSNNFAGVMANSVNAYTTATYSTLTQLGQNWTVTNSAFAAANSKVASVTGTAGQIYSSGGTAPTLNLISSGVTATTYGGSSNIPVIVVDAFGRITSAANQSFSAGGVTSVSGTAGRITSSGGSTPAIDLATAGAGAASYSSGISALTVDAYGRVTAVTGSAGYTTGSGYLPLSGGTMTGLLVGQNPTTSGVGVGNDAGSFSIRGDTTRSAHVSFHRSGAYAINMGLDTDNVFRFGGWSDGSTTYRLQLATPGGTSTLNGTLSATSDVRAPIFYDSNDTIVRWDAGTFVLRSGSPTIYFRDTDHNSAMLHNNSNLFYILRGGNDTESWSTVGSGWWPMTVNLTNNNVDWGGNITAAYNVTAYASDRRLKENIKDITNAIEKIKAIRGVTFDWNDTAEENGFVPERKYDDIGCIAQEVQAILPHVVTLAPFDRWKPDPGKDYTDEELDEKMDTSRSGENYLTIQYERMIPLLIQAIKEQQEQIEELKRRL